MSDRQTMNVSLPEAQERFVRSQVASGRYRSASEVVRDGLRLLEEAEHKRLLEKWVTDSLSADEAKRLPPELVERARQRLRDIVNAGVDDARSGRTVDGADAMRVLGEKLRARKPRKSA